MDADLMQRICEAASDYKMGTENEGFANEFGGLATLRQALFDLIDQWELDFEPIAEGVE